MILENPETRTPKSVEEYLVSNPQEFLFHSPDKTGVKNHFSSSDLNHKGNLKRDYKNRIGKPIYPEPVFSKMLCDSHDLDLTYSLQIRDGNINETSLKKLSEHQRISRNKLENFLLTVLANLPEHQPYWVYKTPHVCLLLSKDGNQLKPLRKIRQSIFNSVKEWLEERCSSEDNRREKILFLTERYTKRQGIFKLDYLEFLDKELIRIERLPTFTKKRLVNTYPHIDQRAKELSTIISQYPHLMLMGDDLPFMKKCIYLSITENMDMSGFPPPLFIENKIEGYFSSVLQLSGREEKYSDLPYFLENIELPFLLYELDNPFSFKNSVFLKNLLPWAKIFIFCLPTNSLNSKRDISPIVMEKDFIGLKSFFLSPLEIVSL